jgi:apolipoprotein N-acyltransferase
MDHTNHPGAARPLIPLPSLGTNLALFAGLVVTAGLPPVPWTGALVPLGLALLFGVLAGAAKPARTAWFFALAHQGSLLHWLFLLDPSKSIPTRALVPIQASAAILYVSLFYLLLGWVFGRVRRRIGSERALLLLPVLWTAMEALRAKGELAFSWCLAGSATIGTPLMGLARTSGEIGLGAGMALLAVAVVLLWRRRGSGPVGTPVLITGLILAAGWWTVLAVGSFVVVPSDRSTGKSASLAVAAIQADVALADKWVDAKIDSTLIPYGALTAAAAADGAEFVVWAETAVPDYLRHRKPLLDWARAVVTGAEVYLYTGFPDADRGLDGKVRTYNSSGLFAPDGSLIDRYAKYHLLPIGEAMPFTRYISALAKLDVGQAEWTPGSKPVPMTAAWPGREFHFSGLICFESIFSHLGRAAVRDGSQALVVITNDGWFGKSAGPLQHAAMARMRAVENGVPVIRCANNGVSFICDGRGRILDSLGLGRRGVVAADIVPGGGQTLYVRYGAWPVGGYLILGAAVVLLAPPLRRRRQGGGPS